MKRLKFSEINTSTMEGKLLLAVVTLASSGNLGESKTPEKFMETLNDIAATVEKEKEKASDKWNKVMSETKDEVEIK